MGRHIVSTGIIERKTEARRSGAATYSIQSPISSGTSSKEYELRNGVWYRAGTHTPVPSSLQKILNITT